jgi:diguanylate cyclase (GGDEF)-like protein
LNAARVPWLRWTPGVTQEEPHGRERPVKLTDVDHSALRKTVKRPFSGRVALVVVGLGLLGVFLIDRATGVAPFQHLYYLPIIFAALQFGSRGAWVSSLAAVALYHLANPALLALAHEERDVIQIVLFIGVGLVTARLHDDARRLEALAGTDDLTGLHNLRAFEQRLRSTVRSSRKTRTRLSLLVLDLDGLKALNDVHGHLAGAEAVRTVGHIIEACLPEAAFACRYGGDEFVVALPGQPGSAADGTALAILESVRLTAPVLANIAFPPGTLSISIGRACLNEETGNDPGGAEPDDDRVGEALFRAADAALYEAKRNGRGRLCVA